mmetsp:Transcript_78935/g.235271  ORF Transcript_78935/g.235271 Transcript_78935/m.235271 type:complete len:218 (+) Transcript_78935:159-812(+)
MVRTSTPATPRGSAGPEKACFFRASAVAVSRTSPRKSRSLASFAATRLAISGSSSAPAASSCSCSGSQAPVRGRQPVFRRVRNSSSCRDSEYCCMRRKRLRNSWFSQRNSLTSSSSAKSGSSGRPAALLLAGVWARLASAAWRSASSRSAFSRRESSSSCSLSTAGRFRFSSSMARSCSRKPSEQDSRPSRSKSRSWNFRLSRSICNTSRCLLRAST